MSSSTPTTNSTTTVTDEMFLLACLEYGDNKVNFKLVAEALGYASPTVASNRLRKIKKKAQEKFTGGKVINGGIGKQKPRAKKVADGEAGSTTSPATPSKATAALSLGTPQESPSKKRKVEDASPEPNVGGGGDYED